MKGKPLIQGGDINRPAALWLMIGLLLVAFGRATIGLDWDVVSTDELNAVSNFGGFDEAAGPIEIVALTQRYASDQMPLYYVVGAYWAKATGYAPVTLRLLGALFALLAMAWLFRLAADLLIGAWRCWRRCCFARARRSICTCTRYACTGW